MGPVVVVVVMMLLMVILAGATEPVRGARIVPSAASLRPRGLPLVPPPSP